jgi:hypothetical protein
MSKSNQTLFDSTMAHQIPLLYLGSEGDQTDSKDEDDLFEAMRYLTDQGCVPYMEETLRILSLQPLSKRRIWWNVLFRVAEYALDALVDANRIGRRPGVSVRAVSTALRALDNPRLALTFLYDRIVRYYRSADYKELKFETVVRKHLVHLHEQITQWAREDQRRLSSSSNDSSEQKTKKKNKGTQTQKNQISHKYRSKSQRSSDSATPPRDLSTPLSPSGSVRDTSLLFFVDDGHTPQNDVEFVADADDPPSVLWMMRYVGASSPIVTRIFGRQLDNKKSFRAIRSQEAEWLQQTRLQFTRAAEYFSETWSMQFFRNEFVIKQDEVATWGRRHAPILDFFQRISGHLHALERSDRMVRMMHALMEKARRRVQGWTMF